MRAWKRHPSGALLNYAHSCCCLRTSPPASEPVTVRVARFWAALSVKPVSHPSTHILIQAVNGRVPLNRLLRVGGIRHIPRRFDITMSCWIFNQILYFFVSHG